MDAAELDVRLLGSFEVDRRGQPAGPDGLKRRGLLALLALEANHVVSAESLIDRLWGVSPPATAANVLQTYVATWRQALEPERRPRTPSSRLARVGSGYRLNLGSQESDILRFSTLAARGRTYARAGRHEDAVPILAQAFDLWRGPPLSDLAGQPWHRAGTETLTEQRLAVLEDWATATLRSQPDASPVLDPLMEALVEFPWRERLTELLMWTLMRAGRQTDALAAFEAIRRRLTEELGTDPGRGLREMQARVLRQDPGLLPANRAAASPIRRHPLRFRLDSFVGRERELSEIRAELAEHRLVTLTGPGGSGKTRLAEQVLSVFVEEHGAGSVLVELAGLRDAALVPSMIRTALGAAWRTTPDEMDIVTAAIGDRLILIVLDNFEHLPDALPVVIRLCRDTTQLRVLVTSRSQIHLSGERLYPVPPLSLPAENVGVPELYTDAATRLFVDRVRAVDPTFELTKTNVRDVVAIIRRVDGLPLALEIAAPWLPLLSAPGLLAVADRPLDLLTREATGEHRHRSMRDAIDWSYRLLPDPVRSLLDRLAVFRGGATLDAIRAVWVEPDLAVLDALATLVDCNLLRTAAPRGGEARFRLLETVRQYAEERLDASGHLERVLRLHAEWFAAWACTMDPHTEGPQSVAWLARAQAEADNLRAAIDYFDLHGRRDEQLELTVHCMGLWFDCGLEGEGRLRLDQALAVCDETAPALAIALAYRSFLNFGFDPAKQAERAVALAHARSELPVKAFALQVLGICTDDFETAADAFHDAIVTADRARGHPVRFGGTNPDAVQSGAANSLATLLEYRSAHEALQVRQQSLTAAERQGDQRIISFVLSRVAINHLVIGDTDSARRTVNRALALADSNNQSPYARGVGATLGLVDHYEGKFSRAEAQFVRDTTDAINEARGGYVAFMTSRLLDLLMDLGRLDDAAEALERAEALGPYPGDHSLSLLVRRARLHRLSGRTTEAQNLLQQAEPDLSHDELRPTRVVHLVESATISAEHGDKARAQCLLRELAEASHRTGVLLPPWEVRYIEAIQTN